MTKKFNLSASESCCVALAELGRRLVRVGLSFGVSCAGRSHGICTFHAHLVHNHFCTALVRLLLQASGGTTQCSVQYADLLYLALAGPEVLCFAVIAGLQAAFLSPELLAR